ncbi:SET domain-containing protein 3 [Ciborinia camelliae]|nr:SET domain-containing protein 3 [Ciborinia camelliae]
MTERSLSISTQIATPIQPSFATPSTSISTNDAQPVTESVDEEPYIISCICDFHEDDGNTIQCDKCETWQHIECYYSGSVENPSREDFDHKCVDCNPRELDGRHATEKQQYRQNKPTNDNNDKKNKRPATKSHKKKTKPSEIQINGFHDQGGHRNAGSLENQTHKKAKGHRSHHSVSSQVTKRSPPYSARNNNHPPSPIHTPLDLPIDFEIHSYSNNFLSLYDDDQSQETDTNTLANLSVTNKLSTWITDAKQFEYDVGNGKLKFDDVVQKLEMRLDPHQFPKLHVDIKTADINNTKIQWKALVTTMKTPANRPIGEINGQIGLQCDYHQNPENRWEECVHPRPLTFFIPGLPLYIDTRAGGSQCRYVRRSCRANANLETYIVANTSEYHFYLTCDSTLPPNEQITLPWDFKFLDKSRLDRALHLDGDDDRVPDISDAEYQIVTNTINSVLSDHGGCACNAGKDCAFVKFHRDYYGRVHAQPQPQPQSNGANVVKSKKGRKPKHHVSPTSTGQATNSRAASEGHQETNDDDTRSISGSVRSKPHSRDLTPMHGLGETNGILTEPTDREKRKLAAVEDSFRKMEQSLPPRKKKRASDGSNMNSPVTTTASQTNSKPRQKSVVSRTSVSQSALANPNGSRSRQYVDASTPGRQSGSPLSATSPKAMASPKPIPSRDDSTSARSRQNSPTSKIVYAHSSTQTDPDEDAWYEPKIKPTPKKPILSLAKRMLKNRYRIRVQIRTLEARQRENTVAGLINGDLQNLSSPATTMDVDGPIQEDRSITQSPTDTKTRNASIVSSTPSVDVISNSGDYHSDGPTLVIGQSMKPPPWSGPSITGRSHKSPELRVQMPPAPTFTTPNLSGTPGSLTPASAVPSSAISPYGTNHFPPYPPTLANGVNPGPAKKKMSLNDYKARKKQSADGSGGRKASVGSSPTMLAAVLRPTLSTIEETKARGALDSNSAINEVKEMADPALVDLVKVSPPKNNMPSQQSNGAL